MLSLDADEWLTAESAEEIRRVVGADATGPAAYRMPRRSSFCGRFMRHSGWWPDYVVRLFRRGRARFSDDSVHERVIVDGALGTLKEPIMHETFVDLEDLIGKMNRYSTLTAQQLQQDGKTAGLVEAIARALWAFLRTYVLRAGFLDGREGFMLALATAEGTYYRYAKLMQLRPQVTSPPQGRRAHAGRLLGPLPRAGGELRARGRGVAASTVERPRVGGHGRSVRT